MLCVGNLKLRGRRRGGYVPLYDVFAVRRATGHTAGHGGAAGCVLLTTAATAIAMKGRIPVGSKVGFSLGHVLRFISEESPFFLWVHRLFSKKKKKKALHYTGPFLSLDYDSVSCHSFYHWYS